MEWWGMQRGWESEIGRARSRIEMVGGDFLSRPRPCMGCSAWEWREVSEWVSEGTLKTFRIYQLVCTNFVTHACSIASEGVYFFMNWYVHNICIVTLLLIPEMYIIWTVIDETIKFSLYFHGSSALLGLGPLMLRFREHTQTHHTR
jgi:hypothetical protein